MDRETIIKLAREAGFSTGKRSDHIYGFDRDGDYTEELECFAKLVAEHSASVEREAVLDLVDDYAKGNTDLRDAIRARGNT